MANPLQLPTLPRLPSLGQMGQSDDAERDLLRDAAAGQIEQERDSENVFWKVLGYIGRPQHAVAGVLHDMIDGGDFSPFDRIGKALAGDEAFGMRDVIDEISPGQWSNVLMPDWMPFVGGQERDLTKDILSLTGDVLTDPLMYVPLGHMMSKAFRKMPKEAPILLKDLALKMKAAGKPELLDEVLRATEKGAEKVSEAGVKSGAVLMSGTIETTAQVKKLDSIWRETIERADDYFLDPVTGKTRTDMEALREGFEPYIGGEIPFASKSVGDQLREGSRTLAQLKLSFGMEKLGIPDVSLVPKAADRMAAGVADMVGGMMSHLGNTAAGKKMVDTFKSVFQWGTGNPFIDQPVMKWMGLYSMKGAQYKTALTDIKNIIGSKAYDPKFVKVLDDLIERPHTNFKQAFRDVPPEYQETVDRLRVYGDNLADTAEKAGLPGTKFRMNVLANDSQAYNIMRELYVKGKGPFKTKTGGAMLPPDLKTLRKQAIDQAYREVKDGRSNLSLKSRSRKVFDELRSYELEVGREILPSTIPARVTGWAPHRMAPEGKTILGNFLLHPKVGYGGRQAYETFLSSSKHRKFTDHTITELNEMFAHGGLPHDYIDSVMDQVRGLAKKDRRLRKDLVKFSHHMGDNYRMFIDDPIQALAMETTDVLRAASNKQATDQILYLTAREIPIKETPWRLGETPQLLSPDGMKAVLGDEWRDRIGKEAAAMYDSMSKELHLKGKDAMSSLFKEADTGTIAKAKAAGIPIFGVPNDVIKDITKVVDFRTSAEDWRSMLKISDDITNYWKATTLALFPAYHARNLVGNLWQGMIGGSVPLSRPWEAASNYKEALDIGMHGGMMSKAGGMGVLDSTPSKFSHKLQKTMFEVNGTPYTQHQALAEMWEQQVVQSGMMQVELGQELVKRSPKTLGGKALKALSQEGAVLGGAFKLGNAMEMIPKMAHFVGMRRQGMSAVEAGASVRKYFHDFAQLSRFEKNVMRRALPFYSWTRKNLPLQLEAMVTSPEKFGQLGRLAEFVQSDEAKQMDKNLLPTWVQEQFGVPTRVDKDGNLEVNLLRSWLPAMDLMAVVNENPIHAMGRTAMGLAHPIPKALIEHHMNVSSFTGKPIERFPGEAMKFFGIPGITEGVMTPKKLISAVKSMPWGRAINELNRLAGAPKEEGFESMSGLERLVSASGVSPKERKFNIEGMIKGLKYDINERIGKLGRAYRQAKRIAKKTGDNSGVKYYQDLLAEAQSHAKDLKGVGKKRR